MKFTIVAAFLFSYIFANAGPTMRGRRAASPDVVLQNGLDAIKLNNQFKSLTEKSSCTAGENACVNNEFAECVGGTFVLTPCASSLICAALPLVNSAGTSITCTTTSDLDTRLAATGALKSFTTIVPSSTASSVVPAPSSTGKTNSTGDAQTSHTLLPSVIAKGFAQNGQGGNTTEPGQVPSLTSTNNFINFCATLPNLPNTNGTQIKTGSCNPTPMGAIPSTSNMPSAKFVSPANLGKVHANSTFTITLAIRGIDTGFFVNPETNYFAAPQQLNATTGEIKGHAHIVIEALDSLNQTTPTNPTKFAFFVGLNGKADSNGHLFANVTGGLPEGAYKMSTIVSSMNHQPVLVGVAQHGALDDTIYFTVTGKKTSASA